MDPNQLAIVLGLLTNGLYSLILFTGSKFGKEVEDLVFREENIKEHLTKDKTIFASIIEETFKELPPVIEQKEFCEFLRLSQMNDIVVRIYSFDVYASENSCNFESIRSDFSFLLSQYFNDRKGVTDIASQLFSILIICCQKSLETIIAEEQDLSALDRKLTFNFKFHKKVLDNYHDNLYREIKANQESLNQLRIKVNDLDHIKKDINELPQKIFGPKGYSSTPGFMNMAPEPEDDFIQRDVEYNQLAKGLLNYQNDRTVAITTALRGAGGYGKTTLAKAICHDPKIKEKFSDGILWITLGEKPDNLIHCVEDLIYHLSGEYRSFGTLDAATAFLRSLIAKRRLLIVIDDVWNSAHLEPFLLGGPYCARLITTRNDDTLPPKASKIFVDSMLQKEAVGMLGYGLSTENEEYFLEFAKKLGYWPLLLKLVNSTLQYRINQLKENIDQALNFVNEGLSEEGLTAFDKENPESRSQAVEATFNVSLKVLTEEELSRYFELAIFPEDANIPLNVLEKLWNKIGNFSSYRVKRLCTKLYSMSLLQTYDTKNDFIKLHDVVREYLRSKQKEKLYFLHSQFLAEFNIERWVDLPEEEKYLWRYLSYHLVEAGKKEDLRKLLLDFFWIKSKLNSTDIHFLINDYDFFHEDYLIEIVKGAIQLSANALSKDKKLLDGQLLGRLELFSKTEIKLMLRSIREHINGNRILPLTGSLTPPGGPLLRTLEGHSDWVNAVSITPDGGYAVSASSDHTLKVWDLGTGKEVRTLTGHLDYIRAVSVTPDGDYAVSASDDKTLKVWDLQAGVEVRTLKGHSNWVKAVSITPDGNYVVSASFDMTLKVWDFQTGNEIRTLIGHSNWVKAVSITSDGNYAISASSDRTLKIWNLRTGKEIRTLTGHSNWVNAVSFTPDGNYAVSASSDRSVKVWDLRTGKEIHTLEDHSGSINAVSVTPNGNYAISASSDRTLKVWDLKTGKEVRTLTGHSNYVRAVSITPDGNYAVSASSDRTLKVWDLRNGKKVRTLTGHSSYVNAVSITPDGNYAISASSDRTLKMWSLRTGKEVRILEDHSNWVNAVSITPDGKYAISASSDRTLKIWNLRSGKKIRTLTGHSNYVRAVSVTPDGNYAVSSSSDKTLKVWDLKTGKKILTLTGHSRAVGAVSLTPDGNYAVSASDDETLKVWDLKIGKEILTLKGHSDFVNSVSLTPDGNSAISASNDRTLKVWDLKTGTEIRTLTGHSSHVRAVSVTSDGNYVISASRDKTIKVWDLQTGKEVSAFNGESPFESVVFSPDGTTIVAGEQSGRMHFLLFERGSEPQKQKFGSMQ